MSMLIVDDLELVDVDEGQCQRFVVRVCEKSGRAGSGDKEAEGFGGART